MQLPPIDDRDLREMREDIEDHTQRDDYCMCCAISKRLLQYIDFLIKREET